MPSSTAAHRTNTSWIQTAAFHTTKVTACELYLSANHQRSNLEPCLPLGLDYFFEIAASGWKVAYDDRVRLGDGLVIVEGHDRRSYDMRSAMLSRSSRYVCVATNAMCCFLRLTRDVPGQDER